MKGLFSPLINHFDFNFLIKKRAIIIFIRRIDRPISETSIIKAFQDKMIAKVWTARLIVTNKTKLRSIKFSCSYCPNQGYTYEANYI